MTESTFDKYQGRQPIKNEQGHVDWATFDTSDQYIVKAKALAADVFTRTNSDKQGITEDFYVVWFCKVLGNWKALVSTDLVPGLYYEVTYDGVKKQTYIDSYIKTLNTCVTDETYASAHLS